MTDAHEPERGILQYLDDRGIARLEEVIHHFHRLTFNQVFFAVDWLSRAGKIRLTRQTPYEYVLSRVCSKLPHEKRNHSENHDATTIKPVA